MLVPIRARVTALLRAEHTIIHAEAVADRELIPRAIVAYPELTGPLGVGDTVLLNATATHLKLGTGGVDFVVAVEGRELPETFGANDPNAHIIKLRYTPHQVAVAASEMTDAYRKREAERGIDLFGVPVVTCGLHSQIAPVAAGVRAANPHAKIAYVMTGGAALPLAFSRLAYQLKDASLISDIVTTEQAFGGDYETVSYPSALFTARHLGAGEIIIVAQGPGNAGTGTRLGFAGVEQGYHTDMARLMNARPVGVLRMSLADTRERHRFLSHHSQTALGTLSHGGSTVAFPEKPNGVSESDYEMVREQLENPPIANKHTVKTADGAPGIALLRERGIKVSSMGRSVDDDPIFFHAASAAGAVAAQMLTESVA